MTGGILRDLTNAVEARRAARKEFLAASKRLAKRIVENGRVGDAVTVYGRHYAIGNVQWYLKENENDDEISEPVKTLVYDLPDGEVVSLVELTRPPLAATINSEIAGWYVPAWQDQDHKAGPDDAPTLPFFNGADVDFQNEKETDIDGASCRNALEKDYELFSEECIEVVEAFTRLFRADAQSYRENAQILDGQQI